MTFDTKWDVNKYRYDNDIPAYWEMKKKFMINNKSKYPEDRLVCLAQMFYNIKAMGCKYNSETMEEVAKLSEGIDDETLSNLRKRQIFVPASDAVHAKVTKQGLSSIPCMAEVNKRQKSSANNYISFVRAGESSSSSGEKSEELAESRDDESGGAPSTSGTRSSSPPPSQTLKIEQHKNKWIVTDIPEQVDDSELYEGCKFRDDGEPPLALPKGGLQRKIEAKKRKLTEPTPPPPAPYAPPPPKQIKRSSESMNEPPLKKRPALLPTPSTSTWKSYDSSGSTQRSYTTGPSSSRNYHQQQQQQQRHHNQQQYHQQQHQYQQQQYHHQQQQYHPQQQYQQQQQYRNQQQKQQYHQQQQLHHQQPQQQQQPYSYSSVGQSTSGQRFNNNSNNNKRKYDAGAVMESGPFGRVVIFESCQTGGRQESPVSIIIRTAQAAHTEAQFSFTNNNKTSNVSCRLLLNGMFLASGEGATQKVAKELACTTALERLRETSFTVKVKAAFVGESGRPVDRTLKRKSGWDDVDDAGASVDIPLHEDNIGRKMMKLMGWSGGGLGKYQQGLQEPICPNDTCINRSGLGITNLQDFRKKVQNLLQEFTRSDSKDDLVFSSDFTKDERKLIHESVRKYNLKSRSFGKNEDTRHIVVFKRVTPREIVEELIRCGGETEKYLLIPPTAP